MHRTVVDESKCFSADLPIRRYRRGHCDLVTNSEELLESLKAQVNAVVSRSNAALALSGGIDSAILAKLMPKGSKAYTFKCVVPGIDVVDESPRAAEYAEECGLDHEIVEVSWEDMCEYAPALMLHKGAPIHSIEVQIYKASLRALEDGFNAFVFGESADSNFGGLSNLLSRDWTFGQYVDRYTNVMPYFVLGSRARLELTPFTKHCDDEGYVDAHEHIRDDFFCESMGSYDNATALAGIEFVAPYAHTWMDCPMDWERVRAGENKYLVRDVFEKLYPGWTVPAKRPMPRPVEQWLQYYVPTRSVFVPHCTDGMTGDQKWLVWSLEAFLNLLDERERAEL